MATENKTSQSKEAILYPSIAISDAFNALGHLLAMKICYEAEENMAVAGYFSVVVAALIGVLRFGYDEYLFAPANKLLADMAGFIGLPLVGYSFLTKYIFLQKSDEYKKFFLITLVLLESSTKQIAPKYRDILKIFINLVLYVIPISLSCYMKGDLIGMFAVGLFVFAGLVVTSDHYKCICGIRCVNLFHYLIAISAFLIAQSL